MALPLGGGHAEMFAISGSDWIISYLIRYILKEVIPIPVKKLSKICEDFVALQGSADEAGQEAR